jgi:hypothetical protein
MIRGSLSINCRGAMESRYTERNRTITETVCDVRYAFVGTVLAIAVSVPGCAALPPAAPAAVPPASAQAGATTIVAVAAPAQAHMTLPEFLGLKGLAQGVGGITRRVRNRLGSRFPGLEAKPPIRSITDPANMSEDASPAVKAAAEAKAEEDQAPQKAKAIRYLASLGCGKCYPDTEDALLAALDDCNQTIRLETVKGLRKSVGDACQCCRQNSCCSPKLLKKLNEIAYDTDESGCYVEPSPTVRRYARLVIRGCGGVRTEVPSEPPIEGPSSAGGPDAPTEAPPSELPPSELPPSQPTPDEPPPAAVPTPAEELPGPPVARALPPTSPIDIASINAPRGTRVDQPPQVSAIHGNVAQNL